MNDLHRAIPETPAACRDAVLRAVSTYREEEKNMKKPCITLLAAALAILLMCGTALAFNFFSVGDVIDSPSEAFKENLVPVMQTQTSHGLTVTLGDAIFDGTDLMASLEITAAEGMEPVYLFAHAEGRVDGVLVQQYGGLADASQPGATNGLMMTFGQLYPSADATNPAPNRLLFVTDAWEPVTGEVEWTLTIDLYTPNWPLAEIAYEPGCGDYLTPAYEMYQQRKIGTYYGNVDSEWIDALTIFSGFEFEYPLELLTLTGAFDLADTLTFTFTTPVQEPENLADGTIYQMDGHTVEVVSFIRTAMSIEYELLIRFDEPQIFEGENRKFAEMDLMAAMEYTPENMTFSDGTFELAEDGMSATYAGKFQYISDAPLTELTLVVGGWLHGEADPDAARFTIQLGE